MALDSNCRRGRSCLMLPHYSPWPTPASEGVNAFAQPIPLKYNIYAFPPFVLLGRPLLRYFLDQGFHGALTLVVPDLRLRRFGGLSFSLSQTIAFCLAGRAAMLCCFFPLAPRMSGRRDVFRGTCGLIAVFSNFLPFMVFC